VRGSLTGEPLRELRGEAVPPARVCGELAEVRLHDLLEGRAEGHDRRGGLYTKEKMEGGGMEIGMIRPRSGRLLARWA
jgi:hypothetical protein